MKHSNRTQKKQSSLVLFAIAALVISIAVISCNGVGLVDDYVKISIEEDFQKIRADLTGNFALVNDITLTENFEPIGTGLTPTHSGTPFTGTFEGNGKTISNLKIIKPGEGHIGFFGAIGAGGEVRNLKLILADGDADSPSIEGRYFVGALVGWNQGDSISNVGVEGGYIEGTNSVGGLVGRTADGSITASYATGDVVSLTGSSGSAIGGLVGIMASGTLDNSYATGKVSAPNRDVETGGLVGEMNSGSITASYATGDVDSGYAAGGLMGDLGGGSITASYATGNVDSGYAAGGLVGRTSGRSTIITASYATGAVTGRGNVGGLVGYVLLESGVTGNLETINTYFDAALTGQSQGVGNIPDPTGIDPYYTYADNQKVYTAASGNGVLIEQRTHFPGWDFTDTWIMQVGEWPRLAWQQ